MQEQKSVLDSTLDRRRFTLATLSQGGALSLDIQGTKIPRESTTESGHSHTVTFN